MNADPRADPAALEWAQDTVRAALEFLVGEPLVSATQISVSLITPVETDDVQDVVATLATPDRARLLGQFVPFSHLTFNGFALPFVRGWFASEMARADGPFSGSVRLHLDVAQMPTHRPSSLYRVVRRSSAEEMGDISAPDSYWKALREYELPFVLLAGTQIAGPSRALLQTVETILARGTPDELLDCCSGSCGISWLGLRAGVRSVRAIDAFDWSIVHQALGESFPTWRFIRNEVDEYLPALPSPQGSRLLVLDPYYGNTLMTARCLARSRPQADAIVVNGGPWFLQAWQERIYEALALLDYAWSTTDVYGERVYVGVPGGRV